MDLLEKAKLFCRDESLRNGAFFTVFSFLNKGINFLLLILLARYITPAEYGYWSLFGTVVMFMGYFIAMTTQGYILVSYFQEGMDGVRKTFSCILSTTLVMAALMGMAIFPLRAISGRVFDFPWRYLYLALGISFFTIYSNICLDFFRLKKNIRLYGVFSCSSAFLVLALSIYFVKSMGMGWVGCVLAQLLCACLFGVIGLVLFLRLGCVARPDTEYWKMMLAWGIPLIPHLAANFIQQGCDRYIINHYFGVEKVGLFSFAYSLAAAIMLIGSGFNDANSVNIFEVLGNTGLTPDDKIALLNKQKRKVFFVYLGSTGIITILCAAIVPLAMPQYALASRYFVLLAVYAFLQCLYYLYVAFLFFFKKTQKLMFMTFSLAVFHFAASLVFTRYSVYCTCLVYIVAQAGVVFGVRKFAIKAVEDNLHRKLKAF